MIQTEKFSSGKVVAVARKEEPGIYKMVVEEINLIANYGVESDYHAGPFVRHRYLARKDPTGPNRRQVNLLHSEVFASLEEELNLKIEPGQMGENITTSGIDLMELPLGTLLKIGPTAVLELTEARIPCANLHPLDIRLAKALAKKKDEKNPRAGMLAVVLEGGIIRAGDDIKVCPPVELEIGKHDA